MIVLLRSLLIKWIYTSSLPNITAYAYIQAVCLLIGTSLYHSCYLPVWSPWLYHMPPTTAASGVPLPSAPGSPISWTLLWTFLYPRHSCRLPGFLYSIYRSTQRNIPYFPYPCLAKIHRSRWNLPNHPIPLHHFLVLDIQLSIVYQLCNPVYTVQFCQIQYL